MRSNAGAGLGIRIVAAIIDLVIAVGLLLSVGVVLLALDGREAVEEGEVSGLGTLISCLTWILLLGYPIVMEAMVGGTVGKLIVGIRVRRTDGRKAGWDSAVLRAIMWIVDGFPYVIPGLVAMVLITASPANQRLGDRVAKTLVVKKDAATATASPTQRF